MNANPTGLWVPQAQATHGLQDEKALVRAQVFQMFQHSMQKVLQGTEGPRLHGSHRLEEAQGSRQATPVPGHSARASTLRILTRQRSHGATT